MSVMIKLQLSSSASDFNHVSKLPGLAGLSLDRSYGVVPIDPNASLFIIRADYIDRLDDRRSLSPEILEAYGDIRISTT